MFTGIITDIGAITAVEDKGDRQITVACGFAESLEMGESVACSGVCLTVVEIRENNFTASLSTETISRTAPGMWEQGKALNLERALKVGDRLSGHMVSGHVDGVANLHNVTKAGDSLVWEIVVPHPLACYIAEKGSVTLEGVSLTVNSVQNDRFTVNVIPHTAAVTTLGTKKTGDHLNFEVDQVARYIERLLKANNA